MVKQQTPGSMCKEIELHVHSSKKVCMMPDMRCLLSRDFGPHKMRCVLFASTWHYSSICEMRLIPTLNFCILAELVEGFACSEFIFLGVTAAASVASVSASWRAGFEGSIQVGKTFSGRCSSSLKRGAFGFEYVLAAESRVRGTRTLNHLKQKMYQFGVSK